jgi:UDP-N-acetyl-D-mannosaminuronate dehydrogenase
MSAVSMCFMGKGVSSGSPCSTAKRVHNGAWPFLGPTMAMIALKCPDIEVVVVDINEDRIAAWNSDDLPIYEPGLFEVVKAARGRNLFFSSDTNKHVGDADIIFVRSDLH